jgi:chorismate dehydratase
VHGLVRAPRQDVELITGTPVALSRALEQGVIDAALIPSIEYLRGAGRHYLRGPAHVATGRNGGLLLTTRKPIVELKRIAVRENSCTPLAVLRVVLDRLYGIMPDFCIYKGDIDAWEDGYDAALLTGDAGLRYAVSDAAGDVTLHDLAEMWEQTTHRPLVLSLWACNDERVAERLLPILTRSRDAAMRNLSRAADVIAGDSGFAAPFVYDYLTTGWDYQLGEAEEESLKLLEQYALDYRLVRNGRISRVLTG